MLLIPTLKFLTVQSRLKIANNPKFDSTSNHRAAAIARMKTNLLKNDISIQFDGEPCSCTPRNLENQGVASLDLVFLLYSKTMCQFFSQRRHSSGVAS